MPAGPMCPDVTISPGSALRIPSSEPRDVLLPWPFPLSLPSSDRPSVPSLQDGCPSHSCVYDPIASSTLSFPSVAYHRTVG